MFVSYVSSHKQTEDTAICFSCIGQAIFSGFRLHLGHRKSMEGKTNPAVIHLFMEMLLV